MRASSGGWQPSAQPTGVSPILSPNPPRQCRSARAVARPDPGGGSGTGSEDHLVRSIPWNNMSTPGRTLGGQKPSVSCGHNLDPRIAARQRFEAAAMARALLGGKNGIPEG